MVIDSVHFNEFKVFILLGFIAMVTAYKVIMVTMIMLYPVLKIDNSTQFLEILITTSS